MEGSIQQMKGLYYSILTVFFSFILGIALMSCTGIPVLGHLVNDRVTVILKGTYESNNPYPHKDVHINEYLNAPYNETTPFEDVNIYLDIAEIRLGKGSSLPNSDDVERYWSLLGSERELLCSNYLDQSGDSLEACDDNNGRDLLNDFFEEGFEYPSKDVKIDTYTHLAIYLRRFIISPASYYDSTDVYLESISSVFNGNLIDGFDLVASNFALYSPLDTVDVAPDLFPLQKTGLSLTIPEGDVLYVVEIRVFLKNLLMKHRINHSEGITTSNELVAEVTSVIGISDWLYPHQYDNVSSTVFSSSNVNELLGGHILTTARVYLPDQVGRLQIASDTGTGPSTGGDVYYAVVLSGADFNTSAVLPLAATKGDSTPAFINNLPLNQNYDLYKTCDAHFLGYQGTSTLEQDGSDGYPETAILCEGAVRLESDEMIVNLDCTCN